MGGSPGQQYLSIEIDRAAIARHGLNVSDVNGVIRASIGGKQATEIYEAETALCHRWCVCGELPQQRREDRQHPGQRPVAPRWR